MMSMYVKAIFAFLSVIFWNLQAVASQNITNVKRGNISCDHVIISASIDPVSSTYTFYWVVSINGKDIQLAQVGLNGMGNVLVRKENSIYEYEVKNDPSSLSSNNQPFTSRITFTFTDNAFENLIFRTISTPLNIPIPKPVNALMCQENITCKNNTRSCKRCGSNLPGFLLCSNGREVKGYCRPEGNTNPVFVPEGCDPGCQEDITCEDGSSSCIRCGSNVSRILSCPNPNRPTVRRYCECNETNDFVQKDCDPGCQEDITCEDGSSSCTRCDNPVPRIISCANGQTVKGYCKCNGITAFVGKDCPPGSQIWGIIILCIGGLIAVIGSIILLVGKCQKNSSMRGSGALAAGVGFFLCGIALFAWRPADGGFIGGGIAFIVVALCSVVYGICACRQKQKELPIEPENTNEYENTKK